jgi:hypothetical protein
MQSTWLPLLLLALSVTVSSAQQSFTEVGLKAAHHFRSGNTVLIRDVSRVSNTQVAVLARLEGTDEYPDFYYGTGVPSQTGSAVLFITHMPDHSFEEGAALMPTAPELELTTMELVDTTRMITGGYITVGTQVTVFPGLLFGPSGGKDLVAVSLLSDSSWDLGTAFRIIGPGEETNLQLGISDGQECM